MELVFHGICKRYGKKEALKDISLCLTEGIYGLLGPNGAGKSTLMSILAGNLPATKGHITLDGQEILSMGADYRRRLGYMPQQQYFYPGFTAEQFLYYIASLRGMERGRAEQRMNLLLQQVGLSEVRGHKIRSFSGGMRQRLLLAQAILDDPDVLILDEPTAGLDPRQRIILRNLIGEIALHKIVLISTHVVSDVETIAKELILLSGGELLQVGDFRALVEPLKGAVWEVEASVDEVARLREYGQISGVAKTADGALVRLLSFSSLPFAAKPAAPSLEDVYLYHFGERD